jgi:hypothetical protein
LCHAPGCYQHRRGLCSILSVSTVSSQATEIQAGDTNGPVRNWFTPAKHVRPGKVPDPLEGRVTCRRPTPASRTRRWVRQNVLNRAALGRPADLLSFAVWYDASAASSFRRCSPQSGGSVNFFLARPGGRIVASIAYAIDRCWFPACVVDDSDWDNVTYVSTNVSNTELFASSTADKLRPRTRTPTSCAFAP